MSKSAVRMDASEDTMDALSHEKRVKRDRLLWAINITAFVVGVLILLN